MQNLVVEAEKAMSPSDESLGLVQPQLDKQLVFHKAIHLNSACPTGKPQAFLNCIFLVELGQKHSSTQLLTKSPFSGYNLKKSFFFGCERGAGPFGKWDLLRSLNPRENRPLLAHKLTKDSKITATQVK